MGDEFGKAGGGNGGMDSRTSVNRNVEDIVDQHE